MFYRGSFELDENHKLCILKTLPCKTNDPVDGNTHFSGTSYGIMQWFLVWLSD